MPEKPAAAVPTSGDVPVVRPAPPMLDYHAPRESALRRYKMAGFAVIGMGGMFLVVAALIAVNLWHLASWFDLLRRCGFQMAALLGVALFFAVLGWRIVHGSSNAAVAALYGTAMTAVLAAGGAFFLLDLKTPFRGAGCGILLSIGVYSGWLTWTLLRLPQGAHPSPLEPEDLRD